VIETGTSVLHLVAAVALARVWGLGGAFAGLAIANVAGLAAASPWITLRPHWHPAMLRKLLRLGVPVAVTGVVGAMLLTADRWVVAGWGGQTMLGYYSFGASVATAATAVAVVVRTVVFAEVYGDAQAGRGALAVRIHLERAVLPFARLLPPLLGMLSLAAGPIIAAAMPSYTAAIPSARLFFFAGAAMGLVNLASIGAVAAGMQRRLPVYAALALALTLALAFPALRLGLGLEGVAGAALAGHLLFAASVLRLDAGEAGIEGPSRFAANALLPLVWCAAASVLVGRLRPGFAPADAAFALGAYLFLLLPLASGWRAAWRRLA
jgi:O-antigen/teichoic acid export membrane protein